MVVNDIPQIEMAESMVDEFGIKKIYPTNIHPNRAKPWLLGKGDWESRKYKWDWDYTASSDNGSLILNFRRVTVDPEHPVRYPGRGRNPVTALPFIEYPSGFIETDQSKLRRDQLIFSAVKQFPASRLFAPMLDLGLVQKFL